MDFFETFGQVVAKVQTAAKNFTDATPDLKKELSRCEKAADEGFKLADAKHEEIERTLSDEKKRLDAANSEQNQVERIQNTELIQDQQAELERLEQSINVIGNSLDNLRESQKDFSIVVYGRTMAGKSTLMEILTHGDGKSIGKGAQRTTRDVRSYRWNGLKITDVPGICAFEGAEDEKLALNAAKAADLILFLITNDAPQADEAACLAQLKKLGKPVLGIINVKCTFDLNSPDMDMDLEDIQAKLADTSTINDTIRQFKAFDKSHNQDWSDIKFVATHLLAAYQSQDKNEKVFEISRFAEVEKFILEKIMHDGRFMRVKTFIDAVAVPMNKIILRVYGHSAKTLIESAVWRNKHTQLEKWIESFAERATKKINGLYAEIKEDLECEITHFIDNNYENKNAGQRWEQRLKNLGFDTRYKKLLDKLADECERKRKELSDELTQEISFAVKSGVNVDVDVESTTPYGQYITGVISATGGLASGVAAFVGISAAPIVIPAIVIGVIGQALFESREENIRKNKDKLREAINDPSFEVLRKIHDEAVNIFNQEILDKGLKKFLAMLAEYQFMLARLGKSQSEMAEGLSKHYRQINGTLLDKAISYIKAGSYSSAEDPLRLPGEYFAILTKDSKLNKEALTSLLGEKFVVLRPKIKFVDNVKLILNCNYSVDSYPLEGVSEGIISGVVDFVKGAALSKFAAIKPRDETLDKFKMFTGLNFKIDAYAREFDKDESKIEKTFALIPKQKINLATFKMAQQYAGIPIIVR